MWALLKWQHPQRGLHCTLPLLLHLQHQRTHCCCCLTLDIGTENGQNRNCKFEPSWTLANLRIENMSHSCPQLCCSPWCEQTHAAKCCRMLSLAAIVSARHLPSNSFWKPHHQNKWYYILSIKVLSITVVDTKIFRQIDSFLIIPFTCNTCIGADIFCSKNFCNAGYFSKELPYGFIHDSSSGRLLPVLQEDEQHHFQIDPCPIIPYLLHEGNTSTWAEALVVKDVIMLTLQINQCVIWLILIMLV